MQQKLPLGPNFAPVKALFQAPPTTSGPKPKLVEVDPGEVLGSSLPSLLSEVAFTPSLSAAAAAPDPDITPPLSPLVGPADIEALRLDEEEQQQQPEAKRSGGSKRMEREESER